MLFILSFIIDIDRGVNMETVIIILVPFFGSVIGALSVFFFKNKVSVVVEKILLGFAAGVMMAASVFSLLIPSIDYSSSMGDFSFVPAVVGFVFGMIFLLVLDTYTPHIHVHSNETEGPSKSFKKKTMLFLAMLIHNIPEGMAVGVVLAGMISGATEITLLSTLSLSIGIALQNMPESAVVAFDAKNNGESRTKAFLQGVASSTVEPLGTVFMLLFSGIFIGILPYFLSFAAGAMIYVVVEELIPSSQTGKHTNVATIGVMIGFALMLILDVALG